MFLLPSIFVHIVSLTGWILESIRPTQQMMIAQKFG